MSDARRLLLLLVLLSLLAVALRLVQRRALVPYPVLLAAAGVGIGLVPGLTGIHLGSDAILLVFVPGLVFEASIGIDLDELASTWLSVTLLATAGVALTMLGIGTLAHAALGLSWSDGMLLGAILAPTDPIAVVAVLRRLRVPARLTALLEGESLFNDGTGIALFAAVLAAIDSGGVSTGGVLGRFLLITAGGAAVGGACGALGVLLLRAFHDPQSEILVTLTLAYGSYICADVLSLSGVVAVVATGLLLAAARRRQHWLHGDEVSDFWQVLAFLFNALLFLLIGAALPTRQLAGAAGTVVAAYLIMVVVRLLPVHSLLGLVDPRGRRLPWRWRHLAVWSGMRGALSVALALSVADRTNVDRRVSTIAYGAVVLSLLVQGGPIRLVARALRVRTA